MAGAIAYPVRHPQWVLNYASKNISADVSAMVTEISYTDHESHLSDEIEVKLEDRDQRWQGPWYPTQGDTLNLLIGYADELLLPCGDFQIDELELDGGASGDTFHIKGIGAGITPSIRTPVSAGYENQTLGAIANTVAAKHGFTVIGAPAALNVQFARVTQNNETDLAFLHRLANRYGYDFSVRGKKLVFYSRAQLEQAATVFTLQRNSLTKFHFKGRTQRIYKAATVSYLSPQTKALISQTVQASPAVATGDTLNIPERAENQQMALASAQAQLHQANMMQTTGTLSAPGNIALMAGVTVTADGFGVHDGKYLVMTAHHKLARSSGYETEVDVRKVQT
jgi:Bacteriophage probable baseplate hub protein